MSTATENQTLDWAQTFFSGRNQLSWESITTQTAPPRALAQVSPWLKKAAEPDYDGPIILPMYEASDRITWYAMALNERRFAQMIEEITGFVGPSYSDFRGEWASLKLTDPSEQALSERFGRRVTKFAAVNADAAPHIESALSLYLSVLARRPDTPDRTQRPFGKIRSDFDRALIAGNAEGSRALIEELVATGRVNAEQQKCLEIRRLAGLGHRESLAKDSALIGSVSDIALPVQTLVDIVVALYETFIVPIEANNELQAVVETFRRHIFRPFNGLFRERKGVRDPKVLRAFILSELAAKAPNVHRCRSFLTKYPETAEGYELARTWCANLSESSDHTSGDPKETWLSQAKQAVADEDYETAITRCFELLPLPWAYSALLRCALEVKGGGITHQILEAFAVAPEAIQLGLSEKDQARLAKLQAIARSPIEDAKPGWIAWAEKVIANPDAAPSIAELQETVAKWSVEEYAADTACCEKFVVHLSKATGDAENVIRDAFPVLVDFFEGSIGARRPFQVIYSYLVKVLGWSGSLSEDEMEIGASLTQALLATGPNQSEYADAIDALQEILKANASPVHFDWGLNLAELLSQYPAPDGGAFRLRLFLDVVGMLRAAPHRVTLGQRELLITLGQDYACPSLLDNFPPIPTDSDAGNSVVSPFAGLIGIYTLTDGAGQRAKAILERLYPQATVEINNDQVSTDRLIALAKAAKIFVFAWRSSKHQAYFCAKEARKGQDIVMPLGKGSASILSAVLEKIRLGQYSFAND